jgi:hypothetical protein
VAAPRSRCRFAAVLVKNKKDMIEAALTVPIDWTELSDGTSTTKHRKQGHTQRNVTLDRGDDYPKNARTA